MGTIEIMGRMIKGTVVPPPARVPVAVLDVPSIIGEQVVLWTYDVNARRDVHSYGFRGWKDTYWVDSNPFIQVVTEADWHRFHYTGTAPDKVTQWPARAAWIA